MSSVVHSPASTAPLDSSSWLTASAETVRSFLFRRRVPLSLALFSSLVVRDMLSGTKPHDIVDVADPSTLVGLGMVFAGLALRSWAAGVLCKETTLTRTGPYSLIRNPLYVGSFLMMFGFCKLVGDAENMFFIGGPVLGLYLLKVRDEERFLSQRFPGEWQEFVADTPRFFPRRLATAGTADWSLSLWLASSEYRAIVGTLIACLALKIWRIF